jgi:hypothetical protein
MQRAGVVDHANFYFLKDGGLLPAVTGQSGQAPQQDQGGRGGLNAKKHGEQAG